MREITNGETVTGTVSPRPGASLTGATIKVMMRLKSAGRPTVNDEGWQGSTPITVADDRVIGLPVADLALADYYAWALIEKGADRWIVRASDDLVRVVG